MAYKRIIEIKAGQASEAVTVSVLHCRFSVANKRDLTANEAKVTIYNASDDTIENMLSNGNYLQIDAGYEDEGTTLLFIGIIAQSFTKSDRLGNKVTEILARSGKGIDLQNEYPALSLSYAPNTKLKGLVEEVCKALELSLSGGELLTDLVLQNGFVFSGFAKDALDKIEKLLNVFDILIYENNGSIFLAYESSESLTEVTLLTYQSGLLNFEKKTEENKKKQPIDRISFTCLLNGNIDNGKAVQIIDDNNNITARIDIIKHEGANFGQTKFITKAEGDII